MSLKILSQKLRLNKREEKELENELKDYILDNSKQEENLKDKVAATSSASLNSNTVLFVVSEGYSIANASILARRYLDSNPEGSVLVYVKEGVYKEIEINQHDVPMYFEDGAIVWGDTSVANQLGIFSDVHLANRNGVGGNIIKIYGKGRFGVTQGRTAASRSVVMTKNSVDLYLEAKEVFGGTIYNWSTSSTRFVIKNAIIHSDRHFINRGFAHVTCENCTFKNGHDAGSYQQINSTFVYRDCVFEFPKKFWGRQFKDNQGNVLFNTIFTEEGYNAFADSRFYREHLIVTGSTGEATITVDGNDYPFILSEADVALSTISDLNHSISNWVNENYATLDTIDRDEVLVKSRIDIVPTGTTGTANVTVTISTLGSNTEDSDVDYLMTFNTDLDTTIADFDSTHSAALIARGVTVENLNGHLIFSADDPTTVINVSIANATGDLNGTVTEGIQFDARKRDQIDLAIANVSGDFNGSVYEDFTADQIKEKTFVNNTGNVRIPSALQQGASQWAFAGGDTDGRMSYFENCLMILYRKKSIGIRFFSIEEENVSDRIGFMKLSRCHVFDNSGSSTTTALVHHTLASLTQGAKIVLDGFVWQTDNGIESPVIADYVASEIIRVEA